MQWPTLLVTSISMEARSGGNAWPTGVSAKLKRGFHATSVSCTGTESARGHERVKTQPLSANPATLADDGTYEERCPADGSRKLASSTA